MILLWERYVSAMVFLWGRIHSAVWWLIHGPTKPKKERLLSPWEIAEIEIECGMEPSWTPPPVASLVTRPPTAVVRSADAELDRAREALADIRRIQHEFEALRPRPNLPCTARMERR